MLLLEASVCVIRFYTSHGEVKQEIVPDINWCEGCISMTVV